MIAILSPSHNPYFNIALEYYLLHTFKDDILLLYRNDNSVVIGKHQNAFSEANQHFLHTSKIPLVRRISGGGAVFHDLGNVNVTLICKEKLNFKNLLLPIQTVLHKLDIETEINKKNDLLLMGKKISGTAAHVYKNKTIHHGTLLYNTSQDLLHRCLNGKRACFVHNGVRSNPSPTINLIDVLNDKMTNEQFFDFIFKQLKLFFAITDNYNLSTDDLLKVNELVENKFSTWKWNFAYSPSFEYVSNIIEELSAIRSVISVKNGIIEQATLYIDNENYFLDFLMNNEFKQPDLVNKLYVWSKKNCPTILLSSIEKLFNF